MLFPMRCDLSGSILSTSQDRRLPVLWAHVPRLPGGCWWPGLSLLTCRHNLNTLLHNREGPSVALWDSLGSSLLRPFPVDSESPLCPSYPEGSRDAAWRPLPTPHPRIFLRWRAERAEPSLTGFSPLSITVVLLLASGVRCLEYYCFTRSIFCILRFKNRQENWLL